MKRRKRQLIYNLSKAIVPTRVQYVPYVKYLTIRKRGTYKHVLSTECVTIT